MRHLLVTECRVRPGKMQEFVTRVQQWERAALDGADAPEFHGVMLASDDPSQVLILTQFTDRERAERFAEGGLIEEFLEGILSCVEAAEQRRGFDLFYAAGAEGLRVVFGEQHH